MARAIDTPPPIRNDEIAATNAHRNRAPPWPRGCRASAGRRPCRSDTPRSTSLTESAAE